MSAELPPPHPHTRGGPSFQLEAKLSDQILKNQLPPPPILLLPGDLETIKGWAAQGAHRPVHVL
jgi:hypothetical protein